MVPIVLCSTPILQGMSSNTLCPSEASNRIQVRPQDRQHALLCSQNSLSPYPHCTQQQNRKICWAYHGISVMLPACLNVFVIVYSRMRRTVEGPVSASPRWYYHNIPHVAPVILVSERRCLTTGLCSSNNWKRVVLSDWMIIQACTVARGLKISN